MIRRFAFIVLCLAASASACLWDSDTLATEAKGFPGMAEVLTGRFERQPALYYQMRLDRVTKQLATDPTLLADYDDAAVACDRLGRGDEGIEWLARKKAQLDRLDAARPEVRDHLYRYQANLGTLLTHRWFRAGARRDAMQDLKDGRDHIAAAIEINPDAHFGRERYQLMVMEWLLDTSDSRYPSEVPNLFDMLPEEDRPRASMPRPVKQDAAAGLAGLIVLGSAWESFDITYALGLALGARGDASLAYFARLRCEELLDAGKGSAYPSSVTDKEIRSAVSILGHPAQDTESIQAYYIKARAAAKEWQAAREQFMLTRLNAGKHPDTDKDFWSGYRETSPPSPPNGVLGLTSESRKGLVGLVVLGAMFILLPTGAIVAIRKLKRAKVARSSPAAQ